MKTIKVILKILIFLLPVQIYSQTFQWKVLPNSPGFIETKRMIFIKIKILKLN